MTIEQEQELIDLAYDAFKAIKTELKNPNLQNHDVVSRIGKIVEMYEERKALIEE